MKITLTPEGGSAVILTDHGREGPSSLTVTPTRSIDVQSYVQADFSTPRNRGNTLQQITFSISKEHASLTAAQLYLLLINSQTPASGSVDIELEDQTTHVLIDEATCEINAQPLIGVTSTLTYTLKFGAIHAV